MKTIYIASLAAICALSVSGCSSLAKAIGVTREAPNEFNILTKAPLVVPPEYNLRPPQAGRSNLADNYSSQVAREALIGDVDSAQPSQGEVLLMTQANVGQANPEIRLEIDGQNSVEQKSDGFTDRIVFWRDGQAVDAQGNPLDPEGEAKRLEGITDITGGGAVTITKRPSTGKLPGL